MTDETYYREIKFIDDHPSSLDEFRGQPHQSVADTLVSILTSDHGGRAIGLEGTWGSGKSTVIDIAQSKLLSGDIEIPNGQKYTFFVFDAWAHQSDPLRRVFLQELIQRLSSSEDAVNKNHWKEKLEILETRRKKVTETKAEKLSLVAKALILTLPFFPIAYSFIHKSILKGSSLLHEFNLPFIGIIHIHQWFLGITIISIPFIFAAITFLTWREGWPSIWKILSPSWWRTKKAMQGKSIIWAFTRQTDNVTTEQFIKEEEATTIEFNKTFDDLIKDAAEHGHRVIIVLDNLDRLPQDIIRATWATMRNFFATTPGTARQSALENVWLIVPFDRAHIETVFGKDKQGEEDDATPGFIEKTFEIVLRVPPPMLSNWREFLSNKLQESFEEKITKNEIHLVFKVFDLFHRAHPKAITPRTIKAFVNTIVAQAKQWGSLIPIEHQALYALYKAEISKNISKLQDSTILDESVRIQLVDQNWAKSLAAAHYNVKPEDALEILLSPEIEKAINEKDHTRLIKLQETSGFSLTLEDYISQNAPQWVISDPSFFFDAAATLAKLSFKEDVVKEGIWRKMISQVSQIQKPVVSTDLTSIGLQTLVKQSEPEEKPTTAKELVRALSITQAKLTTDEAFQSGEKMHFQLTEIADALPKNTEGEIHDEIFSNIAVQKNVEYIFGIAANASSSSKIPFSAFKPAKNGAEIATNLIAFIIEPSPNKQLDTIMSSFILNPAWVDWPPVVKAIQDRLQIPSPPLSADDAFRLLSIVIDMPGKIKNTKTVIDTLITDGSFHGLLGIALPDNHIKLLALVLSELMVHNKGQLTGPANHPQYGSLTNANQYITEIQSSPKDETLISELAQRAIKAGNFSTILDFGLPKKEELEIYRAVTRRMAEFDTFNKLVILDILTNTTRIAEILDTDLLNKFLQKFDDWEIAEKIAGDKWTSIDPQFLILSAPLTTKHYHTTIDIVRSGLAGFTTKQWSQSLKNEDNTLHLLFTIMELDNSPKLGDNFYDALKWHSQTLIGGAKLPTNLSQKWPTLSRLLNPTRCTQFYKWLRDELINKNHTANLLVQILTLFGTDFTTKADFPEKREDVIRVIIDPILAEATPEGLTCLENHAEVFAATLDSATNEEKQVLSNRITQLYEAGIPDDKARFDSLAAKLKLKIEKSDPPPPPDLSQNDKTVAPDSSKSTS